MSILAFCKKVVSGDTFRTDGNEVICLADSMPPEPDDNGNDEAQQVLERLILEKWVTCELVGFSYGRLVANVWVGGQSVNAMMQKRGYHNRR